MCVFFKLKNYYLFSFSKSIHIKALASSLRHSIRRLSIRGRDSLRRSVQRLSMRGRRGNDTQHLSRNAEGPHMADGTSMVIIVA